MKTLLKLIGLLGILAVLTVVVIALLVPWMNRWGALPEELVASYPGDALVPAPDIFFTMAVSIQATPDRIFPWLLQLGAERGGLYSYSWFETNILQCELINADRIHEEWQDLNVGDQVKMCPGDFGPPPYEVALIEPDRALVMGHQENGKWIDLWQLILVPQEDGSTRLLLRGRDNKPGWIWEVLRPGEFIMERGMLLGIKERAER